MFEKCIKCEHLGKMCIPNVFIMPVGEMKEWQKKLKAHKKITNAELSELSGVPKGTIDGHFAAKSHAVDVNYSTFAPIFCALVECEDTEMDCAVENTHGITEEDLQNLKDDYQEQIDFLKEQLEKSQDIADARKNLVMTLGSFLFITLVLIIGALIVDRLDPNLGFFWRSAFAPISESKSIINDSLVYHLSNWRL